MNPRKLSEREFWQDVYIAAVRAGHGAPSDRANLAIQHYRRAKAEYDVYYGILRPLQPQPNA